MSHIINQADRDLHWGDGTHRSVSSSSLLSGPWIRDHQTRLTAHLALHEAELDLALANTVDRAYEEMYDDDDDG